MEGGAKAIGEKVKPGIKSKKEEEKQCVEDEEEEQEEEEEEDSENQPETRTPNSSPAEMKLPKDSQDSTTSSTKSGQMLNQIIDAKTGVLMPRSVSFTNDAQVQQTKSTVMNRMPKSQSTEAFRKDRQASSNILRLATTPGEDSKTPVARSASNNSKVPVMKAGPVSSSPGIGASPKDLSPNDSGKKGIKGIFSRKVTVKTKKIGVKFDPDAVKEIASAGSSGIVSYEALVRLFQCPGCELMMTPPFFQCRKGHMLCEDCKTAMKITCPVCKQRITEYPNVAMAEVYQLIVFPCQFYKNGCAEFHPPQEKLNHEHFCQFRPVNCNFESQG